MNEHDRRLVAVVRRLSTYFNRKLTDEIVAMYVRKLRDIPIGVVEALAEHFVETAEFMPSIAAFRRKAGASPDPNGPDQLAELAWETVLDARDRRGGTDYPIQFADKFIHATIRSLGGWSTLFWNGDRELNANEIRSYLKPRFIQSYKSHLSIGILNDRDLDPLPGTGTRGMLRVDTRDELGRLIGWEYRMEPSHVPLIACPYANELPNVRLIDSPYETQQRIGGPR